ncbi:hypothetical protein KIH41_09670 [Litoribacter ruber]|uniref:hypothetical protein n=1 Tax=Litoribacter ruber TaxID=702568 RepID=UPI001BD9A541|nr:hypothetical protein [Litoribacter ruber]MBT0811545.1 hypothetical protein [Litoribacter ruber]
MKKVKLILGVSLLSFGLTLNVNASDWWVWNETTFSCENLATGPYCAIQKPSCDDGPVVE